MSFNDKGIALVMTLWVVVLLSVVAMSFSISARLDTAGTRNLKEDTQAYLLAQSRYEEVLAYLMGDKDPQVDFLDSDGNLRTDLERPPLRAVKDTPGALVRLRLSDEESRLNINRLKESVITSLLASAGVPEEERGGLIDSLADWMDKDDLFRLQGAEDEYYASLDYKTKNRPLDILEELLLVKGFKREYLYGGGANSLNNILTTWGRTININTAGKETLLAMGMNQLDIDTLLIRREDVEGGLRSVPPGMASYGRTWSEYFRIEVTASMTDSPLSVHITSVVNRKFTSDGVELRTIYWKESIESSRT